MRTALDTNVLSLLSDAEVAAPAYALLVRCRAEGSLVIAGAVYAELLAYPRAGPKFVDTFLTQTGVAVDFQTGPALWKLAGDRYARYCRRRRRAGGGSAKRLLADFVIGAHAQLCADGLATLDGARYAPASRNWRSCPETRRPFIM